MSANTHQDVITESVCENLENNNDVETENCNQEKITDNYVFFFKGSKERQVKFELFYLIAVLLSSVVMLFIVNFIPPSIIDTSLKHYIYAALGGLVGGWAYDVKWFYRVIGRGKNNQHPWKYEENKFYWRIFVPLVSAMTGFSFYALVNSGIFPLIEIKNQTGSAAYSFSFVTGYFSDIVYSKLANWFESMLGAKK